MEKLIDKIHEGGRYILIKGKSVHFALFGGRKCVLERSLCGA